MNTRNSQFSSATVFLTIVILAAAAQSRAQCLIDIDFGTGARGKTGFAATGQSTNDLWNTVRLYEPKYSPGMPLVYSGTLPDLKLADGTASGAGIFITNAPGVWGNATGDPMYDSYVFAQNGSNLTATISRLDPGRYNFFFYGHADPDASAEQNSQFLLRIAETNYGPLTTIASAGWKTTMPWQEGHQYVAFRDIEVPRDTPVVVEVMPGPNGIAVLNGMQIESKGTRPPRRIETTTHPASSGATNLVIREIRYEGNVNDSQALFAADLQIEALGTNELSAPLFKGDVAVVVKNLPDGVQITRSGDEYRVQVTGRGVYELKFDVVAKITRAEPWNQIAFEGPPAAIASLRAQAEEGIAMELLNGDSLQNEKRASSIEAFLPANGLVSLRWQSKSAEVSRNALVNVESSVNAQVTPAVVKLGTTMRYTVLQASVAKMRISIPANQTLTKIEGEQIRDWTVENTNARQVLTVQFIKPIDKEIELTLHTEQPISALPAEVEIGAPQPLDAERQSGVLTLSAGDALVDVEKTSGVRRVNAPEGALAAFRFYGGQSSIIARVRRIEPIVDMTDRVRAALDESRLVVSHSIALKVEKAGIYTIQFTPQAGFTVADVKGDGVEDWKVRDGKLEISFANSVLGERTLEVQLEQAFKTFPAQIVIAPLRAAAASHETADVGVGAAPGLRLKTGALAGLREIPVEQLSDASAEVLAFKAEQPDWKLTLAAERLPARIVADVFNLITIGDGTVGGSATVRYQLINQGVQEFRVQVPAHWKNLEFTGPNIRSREQSSNVWTLHLQEKAWDDYTLVVTYDYQFDPNKASLDAGGLHALDAEHETGSVAVTTAANLKVQAAAVAEPLRLIDPTELADNDLSLITRPVLLAWRYHGPAYQLTLDVARNQEEPVLDAVADRTQLTSVITETGEMLTQASFMVKNNDKQFQRFQLPEKADFWGCYVNGEPSKAERDKDWLMAPLPHRANRDAAIAVDIVYAQNAPALQSKWTPAAAQFEAPKTDVPNTFAQWEIYVPPTRRLSSFDGTMTVARGTTYNLHDAWRRFVGFYADKPPEFWWTVLVVAGLSLFVVAIGGQARARGAAGVVAVLAVVCIIAILASMLLPSLAKAKQSAQRISAVNNLKNIGVGLRMWAADNGNRYPPSLDEAHNELGNSPKLLIDPESGEPFVYVGAGKTPDNPYAILAYSPVDIGGRTVLLADGSVQQTTSGSFAELEQRDEQAPPASLASAAPMPSTAEAPAENAPQAANQSAPMAGYQRQMQMMMRRMGPAPAMPNVPPGTRFGGGGVGGIGGVAVPNMPVPNQAPALAAPPPVAPTVSGLRSIRIEIPRNGQAFTFTKVLNIGGEPLTVRMSVMSAAVFGAVRSTLQASLFLLGLLTVWWQWQNRRNTFLITVGAALALGAVGAMLISTRCLHLVLIALAPVLALLVFIFIARKLWVRGGAPATSPGKTSPPGAASPGIPPAVACLAFFLVLTHFAAAQEAPPPYGGGHGDGRPNPAPVKSRAEVIAVNYVGTIKDQAAQFEAALQFASSTTNQTLPLFGGDVAVESFSVEKGAAKLLRENGKLEVLLPDSGETSVKIKFVVKPGGDAARRVLNFAIPAALASHVSAAIDEPDAEVEFPSAVSLERTATGGHTQIEAMIGAEDRVEIRWTPRVRRAAEIAATVFAENHALVTFADGVMTVRSVLDYQVSQGELRQARLRLPADQRLLQVQGGAVRTWQLETATGGDILVVELLQDASVKQQFTVETEKGMDSLPATTAVEVPHALDVKRETGFVAVRSGEELTLSVEQAAELQRVDAGEFMQTFPTQNAGSAAATSAEEKSGLVGRLQPQVHSGNEPLGMAPQERRPTESLVVGRRSGGAGPGRFIGGLALPVLGGGPDAGDIFGAWRFLNPTFQLRIKAEAVQPQIEAVVHDRLRIGRQQIGMAASIDYSIKRAGIFGLQARLPAGYRIESVQGENIAQWKENPGVGGGVLDVAFKDRVIGTYSLQIELVRLLTNPPAAVSIAGVEPMNVEKRDGFVSVSAEPGLAAKTTNFDGLTEVPAATLDGGANAETGVLAYKFANNQPQASQSWKLEVAVESLESWVRAETAQVLSISENLIHGAAIVRYDIQNAPAKEFRLKIPAAYKNVEISGGQIRQRDQNGEEWRVELQNGVQGTFVLTVTWEEPSDAKTNSIEAVGIQALGAERETGFVVIKARPPLQISEKSHSGELTRIDAAELPDWSANPNFPASENSAVTVLAYRYVRPGYSLSLEARRFDEAAVLQALAEQVRLTTVVADDGQMMTQMALSVRNNGLQHLEIQLPAGAKVWSAFVGGEAVRPARREGSILLPLEEFAAPGNEAPVSVELTYVSEEKFPKAKGPVNLASPALGIPLKNAHWDVYLPPDYEYTKFTGSMTRETAAAPAMQSYSLLEYRAQEAAKEQTADAEGRALLSNARSQIASGDVKKLNQYYRRKDAAATDDATKRELEELDKSLGQIQSSNFLQKQAPESQQNAKTPPRNYQYENEVAQLQWSKLEQAQELAVARARPLHVNLPTRGLHLAFAQVLQTEVQKPLTIGFSALNTAAPNWSRRFLSCAMAVGVLWLIAGAVVNRFD